MDRYGSFTSSILTINRAILKIKTNEMRKYNLKPIHAICLYYLNLNKSGMSQAQLVKQSGEDKALFSRALSCLLERNYIGFKMEKNSKIFFLAEKGELVSKELILKIEDIFNKIGKDLTEKERLHFYLTLNKITTNIELYLKDYE